MHIRWRKWDILETAAGKARGEKMVVSRVHCQLNCTLGGVSGGS